jgi:tricorn protease
VRKVLSILASLIWTSLLLQPAFSMEKTRLLRFPDVYGDRVVFCYAGDLWIADTSGGVARRLTAHPGQELFPKFSPDGRWIAFTGQYDGDEQVYVIPAVGGEPRQLTFYPAVGPLPPRWGYDNQVYGWSPDGERILFRSLRYSWDVSSPRLFTVSFEGGLPEPLPMPQAGAGDFSPDGRRLVYSPLFRDFRTWKRYQGGWAQDLYIIDLETLDWKRITRHKRSDRDPMWIGNRIYFTSDRDGKLNLYAYAVDTGELTQVTRYRDWDVRWPSADPEHGLIVYELGGTLHLLDTRTGKSREIPIYVPDDGVSRRPALVRADKLIEHWGLSPKGERALFVARGDVFSAPVEKGATRNLTRSSDAHDKWAVWSPDGAWIAFVSDRPTADGRREEELYMIARDGSGEPIQLTFGSTGMKFAPRWSPDGERIAYADQKGDLYVVDVKRKKRVKVAHDPAGSLRDYVWSPHGGYLAFSLADSNEMRSIWIWKRDDGSLHRVTGFYFNEYSPAWSPDGKYLYYLADRNFVPQLGHMEWNYLVNREVEIYALALRKDVPHPFPPENDEVTVEEKGGKGGKKDKKKKKDEKGDEPIGIDFEGLGARLARVPVEADNYSGLRATEKYLLYVVRGAFYYGRSSEHKPALVLFDLEEREPKPLVEGIQGYALSQDGKKVLVRRAGKFELYDVKPNAKGKSVSTRGLKLYRVPAQEWAQIFDEVWRRFRDFFYAPNMHGYDWKAIGDQYRQLLKWVAHRADLNYVLGEMIAELNCSHAYIAGGDMQIPDRPKVALPGAWFELDPKSDRYRIAKILKGDNADEHYRSPLTEIGVKAHEGDYVLAIDGEPLTGDRNPYEMLRFKADRPVTLTLNTKPTTKGAWTVTFDPITSERNLVYYDWVDHNRRYVEERTGGRVGYLHIPDMGSEGIREFIKWFYGQIRKEGLIVDARGNGGGNVSQMIIERLRRELLSVDYSRNSDLPHTYPATVFHGHLVCLLNETSASDGDIFPAMFRKAGLGPLIGKRSWGGVIGITSHGPLIDGGSVYVPEYGFVNTDGEWDIENEGVHPDIEVENDPKSLVEGRDPQLDRAIEEVMKAIESQPKRIPPRPAPPVRTQ